MTHIVGGVEYSEQYSSFELSIIHCLPSSGIYDLNEKVQTVNVVFKTRTTGWGCEEKLKQSKGDGLALNVQTWLL